MLFFLICLFLAFAIYFCLVVQSRAKKRKNFPPGPLGIPFFGNALSIGSAAHTTLQRWANAYGPIVGVKFGSQNVIIINDPQILREAFSKQEYAARPKNPILTIISEGNEGVISANGPNWIEQRRFTLKTLRDFGFIRKTMEGLIQDEVEDILQYIKGSNGVPIVLGTRIAAASVNALWTIVSGERHKHDGNQITEILTNLNTTTETIFQKNFIFFIFPKLLEILPKFLLTFWNRSTENMKPVVNVFKNSIELHKKEFGVSNHARDFIDMYLREIESSTDSASSFFKEKGYQNLLGVVADLHIAGQLTTSTTINWAISYLIRFPDIQIKLQEELDAVIGQNRQPTLEDKASLPYTEAFLMEVMRFASIAPLGLFRMTTEDTSILGYDIPKGTHVIGNFYGIHHSQELWGDPQVFRPTRFLTKNHQIVCKSENLMPFGVGKRICLGDSLAKNIIFLVVTSIVQQFKILPANNLPSLVPRCGLVLECENYSAIYKPRFNS